MLFFKLTKNVIRKLAKDTISGSTVCNRAQDKVCFTQDQPKKNLKDFWVKTDDIARVEDEQIKLVE